MGERWEAPAKVNLSLEVGPPDRSGYHPLRSLVQTIELLDIVDLEEAEDDRLTVEGAADLDEHDNLVWKAADGAARGGRRPRLDIKLGKRIPIAAGLGGGSSDAAATLSAVAPMVGLPETELAAIASRIGADVPLFLVGGTMRMEGYGERITAETSLRDFAIGLVVPDIALVTPDVYRRWDEMGGPAGPAFEGRPLPPSLRVHGALRNDLTPAALSLATGLGDLISELGREWEAPVLMSGSGPTLFACFPGLDEAEDAIRQVPGAVRSVHAAGLRSRGVAPEE